MRGKDRCRPLLPLRYNNCHLQHRWVGIDGHEWVVLCKFAGPIPVGGRARREDRLLPGQTHRYRSNRTAEPGCSAIGASPRIPIRSVVRAGPCTRQPGVYRSARDIPGTSDPYARACRDDSKTTRSAQAEMMLTLYAGFHRAANSHRRKPLQARTSRGLIGGTATIRIRSGLRPDERSSA